MIQPKKLWIPSSKVRVRKIVGLLLPWWSSSIRHQPGRLAGKSCGFFFFYLGWKQKCWGSNRLTPVLTLPSEWFQRMFVSVLSWIGDISVWLQPTSLLLHTGFHILIFESQLAIWFHQRSFLQPSNFGGIFMPYHAHTTMHIWQTWT